MFDICYQSQDNRRRLAQTGLNEADAKDVARNLSMKIDALFAVYTTIDQRLCYHYNRGQISFAPLRLV